MNKLEQLREAAGLSRAELAEQTAIMEENIEALETSPVDQEKPDESGSPLAEMRIRWASTLGTLAGALNNKLAGRFPKVSPEELLEPAEDDLTSFLPQTQQKPSGSKIEKTVFTQNDGNVLSWIKKQPVKITLTL